MHKIPILQFLNGLQDHLAATEEAHAARVRNAKSRIAQCVAERQRLEAELERKSALHGTMLAEGVAAAELGDQLNKLREALAALDEPTASATKELAQAEEQAPPRGWNSIRDLQSTLTDEECSEAMVTADSEELFRALTMTFPKVGDCESPETARIHLGARQQIELSVRAEGRSMKDHRPNELSWMSGPSKRDHPDEVEFLAVLIEFPRQWLLSHTKFSRSREVSREWEGKRIQYYEDDFSHLAGSLAQMLTTELQHCNGTVSAAEEYPAGSIASVLKERILAVTTDTPRYRRSSQRLRSPEIEQAIAPSWSAFLRAPWHGGITRHLALLKYLGENGERTRFWNGVYEGHFGFRMRSRDHDWLVGELFLGDATDEIGEEASPEQIIVTKESYGPQVARVGNMWLRVTQEK